MITSEIFLNLLSLNLMVFNLMTEEKLSIENGTNLTGKLILQPT